MIQSLLTEAWRRLQTGRYAEAERLTQEALALRPDHGPALLLLGILGLKARQPDRAEPLLRKACRADPGNPVCHLNLGLALRAMGRHKPAMKSIDTALKLQPELAEAHYYRGLVLLDLQRFHEAEAALQKALRHQPSLIKARILLGKLLITLGRLEEAAQCYEKALSASPDDVSLLTDFGNIRVAQGKRRDAAELYRRALELAPDNRPALDNLIDNRIKLCDWRALPQLRADYLTPALAEAEATAAPTRPMLVNQIPIPVTAAEQQTLARAMTRVRARSVLNQAEPLAFGYPKHDDARLRIGYLCTDFRNHATAHLIQDLFALHDRRRFEIVGYSIGPDDGSHYRQRIQSDCDRFIDLHRSGAVDIVRRIHRDRIDILIDLNGHSGNNRLEALALRPAPIQVGYLGYPGTLGAPFMDYILTDRIVTPPDQQIWFDERFAYLPHSYQINSARPQSDQRPGRSEQGLPEGGFVFCCFNTHYKIEPVMFDIWMRLLKQLPGSLLWLLDGCPDTLDNLRREAGERGVDADRLVFAPRLPPAEHLARLHLADLFLDTYYVNAHTTGSDALWAGVPLLTCAGETFAARVGKSLVHAAGLPELAVDSLEAYEATALHLAQQPDELAALRARLAANRDTCPLFDTKRLVRNLERAYREMWAIHRAGEAPRPIQVREE